MYIMRTSSRPVTRSAYNENETRSLDQEKCFAISQSLLSLSLTLLASSKCKQFVNHTCTWKMPISDDRN